MPIITNKIIPPPFKYLNNPTRFAELLALSDEHYIPRIYFYLKKSSKDHNIDPAEIHDCICLRELETLPVPIQIETLVNIFNKTKSPNDNKINSNEYYFYCQIGDSVICLNPYPL